MGDGIACDPPPAFRPEPTPRPTEKDPALAALAGAWVPGVFPAGPELRRRNTVKLIERPGVTNFCHFSVRERYHP